jgi:hypothetical protein
MKNKIIVNGFYLAWCPLITSLKKIQFNFNFVYSFFILNEVEEFQIKNAKPIKTDELN